jgi:hypothetical protein
MKRPIQLLVLMFVLAGCAHQPLNVETVTVAGQTKTYVSGKYPVGVLGDEISIIDRYDEKGALVHPSDISTTGTVHDTLKAAAGSTGTAAVVTPVIKPIANDLSGPAAPAK